METKGGLTLQQNTEMKTILRIFLMALLAFFIEFFVFQFAELVNRAASDFHRSTSSPGFFTVESRASAA